MTDQPSLSGQEIAALMNELHESGPKVNGASAPPRPFTFGSDAARPMSGLPTLDRMSERMARRLPDVLEPFTRGKPKVSPEAAAMRLFADWKAEQPEFVSPSMYGFKPMKGLVMLSVEPEFVSRLVGFEPSAIG